MFLRSSHNKGFTMVEMLVSIGIMLVITGIIAFNQSHYTSGAELKNLANNLSLSLRQAQVYGISVKEFSPGVSGGFNVGYGANFNISGSGDTRAYIFFADKPSPVQNNLYNDNYTCPVNSECLDKISLGTNNYISKLCTIDNSGNDLSCTATRLDITFVRPAIEAKIVVDSDVAGASTVKGARVELSSNDGTKKNSVLVYTTGQISVK